MAILDDLIKIIKENDKKADIDLVRLAYDFAQEAHKGQKRKSGEPYISHPLETAIILAKMKLDLPTIIAALLHDVAEDTNYNLVDIEKNFGKEVAKLVAGITKLSIIKYRGVEKYAENLRKMFISMADDVRVILIKMADRLHNLKTLNVHPPETQKRIALEVLEIYAPIANRLEMGQLKGQLEDLAFPYAYPKEFSWFKKEIIPNYRTRIEYINKIIKIVKKEIIKEKIKIISIHGRAKHFYSLYRKLLKPQYNKDINRIHDLVAIRIIVPTVSDCYKVLGIIHNMWKPLIGRIKDYISQPKPNGYQSLHTTVFAKDGKIVEFQIRTPEMHEHAEYGIAAHWHYKEMGPGFFARFRKGFHPKGYEIPKKLQWIKELTKWQKEIDDSQTYLKTLKIDVFQNRIFVFTPKGDVIDLPEDATPIDFAYHIHSDIGDKCVGVKVNGKMENLKTKLKNGDVVEIITDKSRKGPSRDWLRIAKTTTAKTKIKQRLAANYKALK
jgi:GTP pyrophosphokinase